MTLKRNNQLQRIQIVLTEPQEAGNIGSVCRAMKSMGFTKLCITGKQKYDEDRIRTLAVHAYDLYTSHRRAHTLEEALGESIFSVGATRRRGKFRKYFSYLPEQLAEHISTLGEGTISVVFGREADGLTDRELQLCHAAVRIPASDLFPSLNLAQAVQVITYVLRRELSSIGGFQPIEPERLTEVTETIMDSWDRIGLFKLDERTEVARFYRDIFARSGLSQRESERIEKMFKKMADLKIHGKRQ